MIPATDPRSRPSPTLAASATATATATAAAALSALGGRQRPTGAVFVAAVLIVLAMVPLPSGTLRALRLSARSLGPNAADRQATEAGYYEGLINVGNDGTRSELALRLLGKPPQWTKFSDIGATKYLPGDVLQFELAPNLRKTAFGEEFSTNRLGFRDHEYSQAKPPGVFRVVLLGASIDMGWGVAVDQTYENLLESWLNRHATRRGLSRRFEVINLAVAAYSPLHRLETYRRKAASLDPDLVLYSATLLDPRLLEIQICNIFQEHTSLGPYPFLLPALGRTRITQADLVPGAGGQSSLSKDAIKNKLRGELWPMTDAIVGTLASDCRSAGQPLWCLLIPRAGDSDTPGDRDEGVARHVGIANHHALPVIDLTDVFDDEEPAEVEIAPWDDHPNAHGHSLLFRALAKAITADPELYRTVFDADVPSATLSDLDPLAPLEIVPQDSAVQQSAFHESDAPEPLDGAFSAPEGEAGEREAIPRPLKLSRKLMSIRP